MKSEQFDQPMCYRCGVKVYLGEDFCLIHQRRES
jgi:hypothetical protein